MGKVKHKKPVVMQVIPELGPGGAEQGCVDICAELVRAGAISYIVSNGGSRLHEVLRAGGIHINLPVHSKNPLVMMANVRALRKLIRKYDVDIVHARSRAPAWSCFHACTGTKARFMTTCHAPYNFETGMKKIYNSSIARGERVIAISHFVADYLRKNYSIDPRRIRIVHRGVALEKFHPTAVTPERLIKISRSWRIPEGSGIIMMPARLTRWKGHHVLIEAMAKLNRPDLFCIIIGSDQGRTGYRQELEDTIRARGLEGNVRIVDHCEDMPAAYMLATVVVSASTDPEGFGRVPMEAQAMGRPVIATDHGGARETIVRGETGWLVPPGDAAALARAMQEALSLNATQRAILATRAMGHVAQYFTKERMADATLNVYAELLQEKLSGGSFVPRDADAAGPGSQRFHDAAA
jgi:glycosyltransferase involved in cell wall biosynthesis